MENEHLILVGPFWDVCISSRMKRGARDS